MKRTSLMQHFYRLCAKRAEAPKTVEQEVLEEVVLIERDLIERELALIDAQCKIDAHKKKVEFLVGWLQIRKNREVPTAHSRQ